MAKRSVAYDPSVIQEFANRLYRQARWITFVSSVRGLIIGFIIGGVIGGAVLFYMLKVQQAPYSSPGSPSFEAVWICALVFAVLGAMSGYFRGRELSFKLRLEAQVALCQVQIERNSFLPSANT